MTYVIVTVWLILSFLLAYLLKNENTEIFFETPLIEEAIKEEGDEYVAKLEDAEYKDGDAVKADDHFGDKYNENMLKELETRKYEFAKEK